MAWIKRNLIVVVSGVIALALIGVGIWYMLGAMDQNKNTDNEINGLKEEVKRYVTGQHFPSQTNIALAAREVKRVNEFIAEGRKFFPASPTSEAPLNDPNFASLLHTTIDNLTKEALTSGIKIETNYHFSFESEWSPLSFPPQSLRPLFERLTEVKQISSVIFKAKVNRLEYIRRARVEGSVLEELVITDSIGEDISANLVALEELHARFHPQLLLIESGGDNLAATFSPELAVVLENLSRTPEAIVVRSVVVQPAESQRRGPTVNTNKLAGLQTILDEHLLRVVMKLDVIKPAGPGDMPGGAGGPGGPGGPGGSGGSGGSGGRNRGPGGPGGPPGGGNQ